MGIRRRSAAIFALAAVGVVAVAAVAIAAPTSTFTSKMTPSNPPKTTYKNGSLATDLKTTYTNPGNSNPGGAIQRTQIYLDKNWKINTGAASKCADNQLAGKTMKDAMTACKNALIGSGTATATANGAFQINGCVLLFNGKPATSGPDAGLPTLKVFTRVQASNPEHHQLREPDDQCAGQRDDPAQRCSEERHGPLRKGPGRQQHHPVGAFPLEEFKTTIGKSTSTYMQAKCPTTPWHTQVTWTYNDNTKKTVSKTQPCT